MGEVDGPVGPCGKCGDQLQFSEAWIGFVSGLMVYVCHDCYYELVDLGIGSK